MCLISLFYVIIQQKIDCWSDISLGCGYLWRSFVMTCCLIFYRLNDSSCIFASLVAALLTCGKTISWNALITTTKSRQEGLLNISFKCKQSHVSIIIYYDRCKEIDWDILDKRVCYEDKPVWSADCKVVPSHFWHSSQQTLWSWSDSPLCWKQPDQRR